MRSKASLRREAERKSSRIQEFKRKIIDLLKFASPQVSYSIRKDLATMTNMPFYKDRPKVINVSLSPVEMFIAYTKIFFKSDDEQFITQLIRSLSRNQSQTLRKIAPRVGTRKEIWDHVIPVKVIVDEIITMVAKRSITDLEMLLRLYERAGQIGITKKQNDLLKSLDLNSSMPENWNWRNDNVNLYARYEEAGITRIGEVVNMNKIIFLETIYSSIKVGDFIQKPTKVTEILDITESGHIYYRIGKKNRKAVTKSELIKVFEILTKRDITNSDIRDIATKAKPCNVTSIKWLLTNSGLVIEQSKGVFRKNW